MSESRSVVDRQARSASLRMIRRMDELFQRDGMSATFITSEGLRINPRQEIERLLSKDLDALKAALAFPDEARLRTEAASFAKALRRVFAEPWVTATFAQGGGSFSSTLLAPVLGKALEALELAANPPQQDTEHMTILDVYIPTGSPIRSTVDSIEKGSGIVGLPRGDGTVLVYFEGNLYGSLSMRRYDDRVYHAASRLVTRYPTRAFAVVPAETVQRVGSYNYEEQSLDITEPGLLNAWAGEQVENGPSESRKKKLAYQDFISSHRML